MLDLAPIQGDFERAFFNHPGVNFPYICVFKEPKLPEPVFNLVTRVWVNPHPALVSSHDGLSDPLLPSEVGKHACNHDDHHDQH